MKTYNTELWCKETVWYKRICSVEAENIEDAREQFRSITIYPNMLHDSFVYGDVLDEVVNDETLEFEFDNDTEVYEADETSN